MNLKDIKAQANDWIADANMRNASHEHPESLRLKGAATTILSLCAEIERLTAKIVK